jgi:hypothetical protein
MASFLIVNAVQFEALPFVKEIVLGPAASVILGVLLLIISGNLPNHRNLKFV